jgi:putative colanic acid biosynthesis UDP-glucose lipid carrier transferase
MFNSSELSGLMRLLDASVALLAADLASYFYFGQRIFELDTTYLIAAYLASLAVMYLFSKFDLYSSWRGRPRLVLFFRLAVAWGTTLAVTLLFSYLIHKSGILSRLWMFWWFVAGVVILWLYRLCVYAFLSWMRARGWNVKHVMLVGYGASGREIHKRALQHEHYGYEITAIHCSPCDLRFVPKRGIHIIDKLTEIPAYVTQNRIDEVWLALQTTEYGKLEELHFLLRNALVDVRWIPDTPGIRMVSRRTKEFLGMLSVDLNSPESMGIYGITKEVFDRTFALLALILLATPFCVIALAIKLTSPGPVFFLQVRHGLNGTKFKIYKFRTMKVHDESNGVAQAVKGDPRVTWLGSFLRRSSIDELPQFINVLKGEMSIVGPRPHALEHNEYYRDKIDVYMLRHRVKPGITGLAQIRGLRGETESVDKMNQRVELDLEYIRHWTIWLDFKIVLWTSLKGWSGNNVY